MASDLTLTDEAAAGVRVMLDERAALYARVAALEADLAVACVRLDEANARIQRLCSKPPPQSDRERVYDLLAKVDSAWDAEDVATRLDLSRDEATRHLLSLVAARVVEDLGNGLYVIV